MKRSISAFFLIIMFLICLGTGLAASQSAAPAVMPPEQTGLLPTVTVTLPPVTLPPLPPVTVRLPPVRVTVAVPGAPVTVTQPGPTRTVTVDASGNQTVAPAPTKTVTVTTRPEAPQGTQGPVLGPSVPSSIETIFASPSGQPTPEGDTIETSDPVISLPDIDSVPEAVGYSLLSLLLILLLTIGGMVYGFRTGRKSKEKEDTDWMRDLLERISTRKQ